MNPLQKIDIEPMIWFLLAVGFIFTGSYLIPDNSPFKDLALVIGGAVAVRIRSSKSKENSQT